MKVRIEKDSISVGNQRITTFVLEYPRFIHSQMMTHRVFSRNASSSRAIPAHKIIATVKENPVIPVEWGKNQRGMFADEELPKELQTEAMKIWLDSADKAVESAEKLNDLGVHKQIVNRILEPYSWISVVLTGTDFANFFALRTDHAAQPEIQAVARKMKELMKENHPHLCEIGKYHLPFSDGNTQDYNHNTLVQSVARCARVSYLNHGTNKRSTILQDNNLYELLLRERHMSPFEHQAKCMGTNRYYFNLLGWASYRYFLQSGRKEYENI